MQRVMDRGIRNFVFISVGQIVSLIGSGLTSFALGVWVYQSTGSTTLFTLIFLFAEVPGIVILPLAGTLVDRWNRRMVVILSDCGAALCTLAVALLFSAGRLEVWHIYLTALVGSILRTFQWSAYSASVALLVPNQHLGRANGVMYLWYTVGAVVSPVVAGSLVAVIHIQGVALIDIATFLFAIIILLFISIPQPQTSAEGKKAKGTFWQEAAYGWVFLIQNPGLLGVAIYFSVVTFALYLAHVLLTPLVLSFASARVLGVVLSVAATGGVLGGISMSAWGGPKRRVLGVFGLGLLQGIVLLLVGARANVWLIAPAAFALVFCYPIAQGSNKAIFQSKVAPDVQGRVFAVSDMIANITKPLAYLLAGPLADRVFEPLLAANGRLAGSVGLVIGVGQGRGIGFLYILIGAFSILVSVAGFLFPRVRFVEDEVPDALPKAGPILNQVA